MCAGGSAIHSVVRSAATTAVRLACCDDDGAAVRELYDLRPSVLVIEIGGAAVREPPKLIRLAKRESPKTYVIGYCSLSARAGDEVLLAARAGLDTVIFHGQSDARRVLCSRIAEHVADLPGRRLTDLLGETLHPLAMAAGFRDTRAMRAALKRRLGTGVTQLSDLETAKQLRHALVRDYGARARGV